MKNKIKKTPILRDKLNKKEEVNKIIKKLTDTTNDKCYVALKH